MSNRERDPSAVAARYRVKQVGETEFELYATQGTSTKLDVRRLGAFLHFKITPHAVRWHAAERSEAFYVVHLLVTELSIGHRGEEGWSSGLVDNCFFIIDGEALKYVPLTELRILSEEQFNVEKARLAANKGETLVTKPEGDGDSDLPVGRATIVHCPAMPEHNISESLECTIGLPQAYFQQLLDGCLSRRISAVHINGIGGALSSSFQYGAARDLILCAGKGFDIHIDSIDLEYRV